MVSKLICLFIHIFACFIIIFNISARPFHFIKWKKNNKEVEYLEKKGWNKGVLSGLLLKLTKNITKIA